MHLYRHTPSGQSRVYRVTQLLRTDGCVHCRESVGTGPVVIKVVTSAAFVGYHGPVNVRLSFPTLTTISLKWAC